MRTLVWLKHIAIGRFGESGGNAVQQHWLFGPAMAKHNALPGAVSQSCVDPRFGGLGDLIHEWQVFHTLRVRTGRVYRIYGVRLPGPDTVIHMEDSPVAAAYRTVVLHTLKVAHAKVLVVTAHLDCAGVDACGTTHHAYCERLGPYWLDHTAGLDIVVLLAHPRVFGWRQELIAHLYALSHKYTNAYYELVEATL